MSATDMWTWDIDGLDGDSAEQTLTVWNPSGEKVGSETRSSDEGWQWPPDSYPNAVKGLMPSTLDALMAIQQDRIERTE